uniref:Phage ABA sandwich domain-containing protein n=1 Tax=viral metagenome TaxID=1070528 RepID=A0A6H1ZRF0_9ZZZZ
MVDKQALNKKLAEWAGFVVGKVKNKDSIWYNHALWTSPDGRDFTLDIPVFTDSLDACFKWLVPKVEDPSISVYKPVLGGNYWVCVLGEKGCIDNVNASGETPALALCLAIEKLIDSQSRT